MLIEDEDKDRDFPPDTETNRNGASSNNGAAMESNSIKDEIIEEDAIAPLVQCATEEEFSKLQAKQPAVEILVNLAFHKNSIKTLRNHPKLRETLQEIHDKDDIEGVSKDELEILLWNLITDKKQRRAAKKNSEKFQIMFSYSHNNKDVCNKIYNYLGPKYKVWIDTKHLKGRVRDAMATAVESSTIVIMCLSSAYTESKACRWEAEYAFDLKRHVIPIYVDQKFRIKQGWLYMLINGLNHLDYHKLGADFSSKLTNEINGYLDLDDPEEDLHLYTSSRLVSSLYR